MNLVFDTNSPGFLPETSDGFLPFRTATFKKLYSQSKAPTRGPKPQVIGLAPQRWQMSFQSDTLNWSDANALMTVLEGLEVAPFCSRPGIRSCVSRRSIAAGSLV